MSEADDGLGAARVAYFMSMAAARAVYHDGSVPAGEQRKRYRQLVDEAWEAYMVEFRKWRTMGMPPP